MSLSTSKENEAELSKTPAFAVGGIGGSGTRVIAQLLRSAGYYIGSDLNDANDNLWFVLLFNRHDVLDEPKERFELISTLFFHRMQGSMDREEAKLAHEILGEITHRPNHQHTRDWLQLRAQTFLDDIDSRSNQNWGWKCPPTHIVIERLLEFNSTLRYIHVTRNGLDMAFSKNQNQLKMWGPIFLGPEPEITPRNSLAYWCIIERRVRAIAERFPDRIMLVDFDRFCFDTPRIAANILKFCGQPVTESVIESFAATVTPPLSIDRFRAHAGGNLNSVDVHYVASLGYPVG